MLSWIRGVSSSSSHLAQLTKAKTVAVKYLFFLHTLPVVLKSSSVFCLHGAPIAIATGFFIGSVEAY